MCAYKLCRVQFHYWGMQTKLEKFVHEFGKVAGKKRGLAVFGPIGNGPYFKKKNTLFNCISPKMNS
jgi:Phosphatidylinositol transfer protein.